MFLQNEKVLIFQQKTLFFVKKNFLLNRKSDERKYIGFSFFHFLSNIGFKYFPVYDSGTPHTSSGVP